MSSAKLIINPKDYKLKCSEEVLKTLKPYFELKSSSYSHYSHTPQLTTGQNSPKQDSQTSSTPVQPKQESKTNIHLTLRDANSGELLGKGSLVYDHSQEKPEKFEETIALKDILGNEIGEAILEITQVKPQQPKRTVDDEFRRMRKELAGMMRATNSLFDRFSRRHFGRDWGFGLLDDFHPMMMLGEIDDYNYHDEPKKNECRCHHHEHQSQPKTQNMQSQNQSMVNQLENTSSPIIGIAENVARDEIKVAAQPKQEVEISNE